MALMSKKRSCRRSKLEKSQHDTAVKIRKMTDEQICEFLDEIEKKHLRTNKVSEFIDRLSERNGLGGVSPKTVEKIRALAAEMGYAAEVS